MKTHCLEDDRYKLNFFFLFDGLGSGQVCSPPDRWRGGAVHAECNWRQRVGHDASAGREIPHYSTGKY